ncbi:hypothetical protein FGE12_11310 [Aggregicoccus sp. 17bor-14]|uniref:hypothetical protein n=1 Tax=Myxococcaceae TaxID=31 RepID=UPI00129D20ED|nr:MULTISPECIES: hypothetical protein [Myxococcaceae]MBF5042977.1 hypothetical protein [Simulacricoccus sp. 17bor-14]MRI88743.1 hypothetical protein [Aggregicoccus sp. 17bor-14]
MANENEKRTAGRLDEPGAPNVPQAEGKGAAPGDERTRSASTQEAPEHRPRSMRQDLADGDPAGTPFSEEMGHTPTRET